MQVSGSSVASPYSLPPPPPPPSPPQAVRTGVGFHAQWSRVSPQHGKIVGWCRKKSLQKHHGALLEWVRTCVYAPRDVFVFAFASVKHCLPILASCYVMELTHVVTQIFTWPPPISSLRMKYRLVRLWRISKDAIRRLGWETRERRSERGRRRHVIEVRISGANTVGTYLHVCSLSWCVFRCERIGWLF